MVLTHVTAGAAVPALPGPWPLLALGVAASLAYQLYVHVLHRAPWSIRSVLWQPDGRWRIYLRSGQEREATLSPSTFVSVPLIVLNLRIGRIQHRSLTLFADALDPDQHRRLRQRLRLTGAKKNQNASLA